MCGIIAYYNKSGVSKENLKESLKSLQSVSHRGPDGEGVVLINTSTGDFQTLRTDETPADINTTVSLDTYKSNAATLLLGHRRLSIIDLTSRGHQPMKDNFGNWIIHNGEIYNYIELRKELEAKGHKFCSDTDTEVILAAYREYKADCLSRFNGMWAFIIWDNKKNALFISNDRFGVKPLYHLENEDEIIFCSEQKQFLHYQNRITGYNHKTIASFLDGGIIDFDESTFFKNIWRFKPSTYQIISLKENKKQTSTYYTLPTTIDKKISEKDAIEKFETIFEKAVQLRLRSDVKWGVTISGGVDSSAIIYSANKLHTAVEGAEAINSFSAIFPGKSGDESHYIKIIEKDLGLKAYYVNPVEVFSFEDFERHIYHQDSPITSTSFYAQWCVARIASENGIKVLLNGQGADEVYAGYHHHFYKYCLELLVKGKIATYFSLANKYAQLKGMSIKKIHQIILGEIKSKIKVHLGLSKTEEHIKKQWMKTHSLIELLKLDFNAVHIPNYLKSDDRDAMAFSIETRHPFLDYNVVDFGYQLPAKYKIKNGWQKWVIRASMNTSPNSIQFRKDKKGFTTPQDYWVSKYRETFEAYLPYIDNIGIENYEKNNFRSYALGGWLKTFNI
ncbi:MAG: asparagine synthase (glutamine-hydrolyzing) [Flavobacteriales bacterium]|nr:asparagine synthase (glutamine-hydrolyzing) [Bacteroidales bacterium AH-315-I05]PCJ89566.1 MAG: asparagine synthase (glutamine-hydrolyzing) [Flavobacteriales bacterium]